MHIIMRRFGGNSLGQRPDTVGDPRIPRALLLVPNDDFSTPLGMRRDAGTMVFPMCVIWFFIVYVVFSKCYVVFSML